MAQAATQNATPNATQDTIEALGALLAATYTLYLKTHNYHWNVTGPMFTTLHTMFETQYTEMALAVDEIAERIRALGAYAPASYSDFTRLSAVKEEVGHPSAVEMIRALVGDQIARRGISPSRDSRGGGGRRPGQRRPRHEATADPREERLDAAKPSRVAKVTTTSAALIGLATILAAATLLWMLSVRLRDASIADVCWGAGFALLAWVYWWLSPAATPRAWLVVGLVTLWGARLSSHIYRRHHGKGEDPRYQAMRASHGQPFWWRSLFTVFLLQGAILWFVALPILVATRALQPAALTLVDGLGLLLFVVGFGFEVVGDRQLGRFRADPANRGKVLDTGLWRYTRHPNYFGDATMWWGFYLMAAATPGGWLTVLSPSLMTLLLLRVSGVTLLEEGLKASKPGYREYIARTPAFVPWFPRPRR